MFVFLEGKLGFFNYNFVHRLDIDSEYDDADDYGEEYDAEEENGENDGEDDGEARGDVMSMVWSSIGMIFKNGTSTLPDERECSTAFSIARSSLYIFFFFTARNIQRCEGFV